MTHLPPTPSTTPFLAQPPLLAYSRPPRRSYRNEFLLFLFVWFPALALIVGLLFWQAYPSEEEREAITVFTFVTGPIALVACGTMVLLLINTVFRGLSSTRHERSCLILGYLENAIRLNFPLDRFLQAAQESEHSHRRYQLAALRHSLQQGMSVGAALSLSAPDVPEPVAMALAAAENIGQLQPALSRLIARDTRDANREPQTTPFYRFYFPLMIAATIVCAFFILTFVAPKFRDIFKDFHTTLPPLTYWFFNLGGFFLGNELFDQVLLFVLAVLILLAAARSLQKAFQFLRGNTPTPFFFDLSLRWMAWYLPFSRQMIRNQTLANVMEFLADALRAGLPLPQALDAALALSIPPGMRRPLERWLDAMLSGKSPADAARHAPLPRLITGFLGTASHAAPAPAPRADVFEFLARYYRERFSRTRLVLRAAAEPAAALLLGLMVGTVVLSIFLPLVKLINAVMQASERGFL